MDAGARWVLADSKTTVVSTSVNDEPVITGAIAGQAVNDTLTDQPFAGVTINDPDLGASETVTITLKAGASASDANGLLSGTGLTKTGVGTYKLTAGTPAAVSAALQALTFTPTANQVAPGSTVTTGMTLSVTDGIVGSSSTNTTTTVVATSVNDVPLISGALAGQTVNDNSTDLPFATVTVGDADLDANETITITLTASGSASDSNGLLSGTGLTKTGVGTYTLAAGTPASVTAALKALVFTPTPNQVSAGGTVTTGLTLSVTDGIAGSPSIDTTTTEVATAVGSAPVIAGAAAGQAVNDTATDHPFATLTITDPNAPPQTEAVTITLSSGGTPTDANGLLSGSGLTKTGVGTYTLASGSDAAVTSALQALIFTPTANQVAAGSTVTTSFKVSVTDTAAFTASNSTTSVVATSVDDAPTITGAAAGQAVNDTATDQPFSAVTIGDPDVSASETVSITLTANGSPSDANGVLSGTGLTRTGVGTYTLAAGTPAAVTTALRALVFTPTANQAAPGSTVTTGMTLSVSDGIVGSPTTNAATTVVATSVNDAPAVTGAAAGQSLNDNATDHPFSVVTISDADLGASETITITLKAGASASDANGLLSGAGLTKTGVGTYTLAAGTPAAVTTALRALTFTPTANQVAPGGTVTTGMTLLVTDEIVASPTTNATTTVIATSVNDAPVISGAAAGQTVNDRATDHPFYAVTISAADLGASETVTIRLTASGSPSDANGSLSGTGLTQTGVGTYVLAADTPAAVTAALQALVFTPTPGQVAPGLTVTTGMTLSVDDGIAGAPTSDTTTTLVVTAVGTALDIGGTVAGQAVGDDTTTLAFVGVTISDSNAGSPSQTVTISLTSGGVPTDANGTLSGAGLTQTGVGSYTLSAADAAAATAALQALVFTPTANQVAAGGTVTTGITLSVTDQFSQSASDTTTTIVATSVNDLPSIDGALSGQTLADTATGQPFAGVTIGDPDVSASETVTIILTAGGSASDANGTLSGAGLTHTGTGSYTLAGGAPAAVTAALQALVFTPTANQIATGGSITTGFTLAVSDGIAGAPTTDNSTTVVTTSVNDAPVIEGTVGGQVVNDNATDQPFAGVAISDPDAGASETVSITLTAGGSASDANGTLSGTGLTHTGVGTYSLSAGTPAAVTAALRGLVFTPTANQVAVGGSITTGFTLAVSDGIAGSPATDTGTSVSVTSADDPPGIACGGVLDIGVPDQAESIPLAGLSVVDPDPGDTDTLIVALSPGSGGTLTSLSGGSYNPAAGVYSLTGSAAELTAALQALTFTPAAPVSGYVGARTQFALTVTGGSGAPATLAGPTVTPVRQILGLQGIAASQIVIAARADGVFPTATPGKLNEAVVTNPTIGGSYVLPTGYQAAFLGGTADAALTDTAVGNALLVGNSGNDTISASLGTDTIQGGSGSNLLSGGNGAIILSVGDHDTVAALSGGFAAMVSGVAPLVQGDSIGGGAISVSVTCGQATVQAASGDAAVTTAGAAALVLGGFGSVAGALRVVDTGQGNTISGWHSSLALTLGGSRALAFGGSASMAVRDGGGADTIVAGTGAASATLSGSRALAFGGAGTLAVQDGGGADTIVAGSGAASVTLSGSRTLVFGGADTLAVRDGGGADTIVAGAGAASVTLSGSQALVFGGAATLAVQDGGGADTIVAGRGTTSVSVTGSQALVFGGTATLAVQAGGRADTIVAGTGPADVSLSGSRALVFGGGATLSVQDAGGADTIVAGPGAINVTLSGSSAMVFGGAGPLSVQDAGSADTIIAGAGATDVTATTGNSVVFGGGGTLNFVGGTGGATIYAGAGQSSISGGAGGATLYGSAGADIRYGGAGRALYVAGSGSETLDARAASGGNELVGGGDAGGRTLILGGSGDDTVFAGAGAETLGGGGGANLFAFAAARTQSSADVILDFGRDDAVLLDGYGANQAATALAHATSSGGNTTITLADNTQITFLGVAGAAALQGHVLTV